MWVTHLLVLEHPGPLRVWHLALNRLIKYLLDRMTMGTFPTLTFGSNVP